MVSNSSSRMEYPFPAILSVARPARVEKTFRPVSGSILMDTRSSSLDVFVCCELNLLS